MGWAFNLYLKSCLIHYERYVLIINTLRFFLFDNNLINLLLFFYNLETLKSTKAKSLMKLIPNANSKNEVFDIFDKIKNLNEQGINDMVIAQFFLFIIFLQYIINYWILDWLSFYKTPWVISFLDKNC